MFYSVPSQLIGYRLKLRIYDDRLECFLGQSRVLTLPRGRAPTDGRRIQVVELWAEGRLMVRNWRRGGRVPHAGSEANGNFRRVMRGNAGRVSWLPAGAAAATAEHTANAATLP